MADQSSAFTNEDRKILKQLFSVVGLFVAGTIILAVAVNIAM